MKQTLLIKKPRLAATIQLEDLANLQYPLWVSEKKDGIRAITSPKGILSRKFLPLPNKHLQLQMCGLPPNIEGEIVRINSHGEDSAFEETESCVMSREGTFKFRFYVFDWLYASRFLPFRMRQQKLAEFFTTHPFIRIIPQYLVINAEDAESFYTHEIKLGREGIMLADPRGFYKFGRSTVNEQILLKLKPWLDSEATIVRLIEANENQNPKSLDKLGHTKRSRKIANLQGKHILGAIEVQHADFGTFQIGTGWREDFARSSWENRQNLIGNRINFRYRALTAYGKPKHASFVRLLKS